jgi:predicted Zn-dependent peptidase
VKEKFSRTALDNGMRVISEYIPSFRSVSIGIWVHVGSRDENAKLNGISHFIEHMHFKGTKKRSAFQIAQALEVLGGSLNAFTSREHTCYYARVLNQHLPQAMELLGDILNNSLFAPGDIKKEKSVILEEIKDVADTPSEYIHDLFADQMFKSDPLGQPIMGYASNVPALTRAEVVNYIRHYYTAPNIVVAAAGDLQHQDLVALTRKYFPWKKVPFARTDAAPRHNGFSTRAYRNRTKQTHVCLGFPSIDFSDKGRYPLMAANAVLSGGMSSRLFQSVRENSGYCYTIYSFQEFFRDAGLFCVYFGSDGKYVVKATELVLKELRKIREKLLSRTELTEIKDQLKGSLMLSQESTYNRMNRIARQEMMLERYVSLDETCRHVDMVTAKQVREVCNEIFRNDTLTFSALGPTRQQDLEHIKWSTL